MANPEDLPAKLTVIALLFNKKEREKATHSFSLLQVFQKILALLNSIWQINKNLCPQMISDKTLLGSDVMMQF